MRHRVLVPVLTLTCGLAACDGVRDSDYEGEVLASLEGTVTTADASDVPEDISVPVIWDVMSQEPRLRYAEFPEVTGDFPARFRLDFHQPPEEEQLVEFPDGNAIALGRLFITTYDPDEPLVLDEQGGASFGSWGCNDDQIIAFIREDVVPGSAAASYFGCGLDTEGSVPCSALTAGYHVMDLVYGENHTGRPDGGGCASPVSPDHPDYCDPDDVRLAPADLDTEIVFNVGGPDDCFMPWYRDPRTGW